MLRYLNAGESHGICLVAVLEGIPAGLPLVEEEINQELVRRQRGYGRGGRMKIEKDQAQILSGVRQGKTLGSPIALRIENKDWKNWEKIMSIAEVGGEISRVVTKPRPGHADLAGAVKYGHRDLRNILERASARETVTRVAVGAISKRFLKEFGIEVIGWVVEIGGIRLSEEEYQKWLAKGPKAIFEKSEASELRVPDKNLEKAMMEKIDEAKSRGDTSGGVFEVQALGVPIGLGSHVQWDRKLDGRLAQAVMSIQAIKGVEIGLGFEAARRWGSEVHDEIFYKKPNLLEMGFHRGSNRAGGTEGGMSNGQPIVVRGAMKPISTLYKPMRSVDIETKETFEATVERSDFCAVPSACVVAEGVVAFEIARAFLEKFGGDSLEETIRNYKGYLKSVQEF
ncbi:MAG: chorismate synthase [Deltaproteobacteria bacterium]|nr:chorismate synthase [Deltaproteobacteria bacterium]